MDPLRAVKRTFETPFTLELDGSADPLDLRKVLRVVPGRRAVFSGRWMERKVVAKLFLRPHHYRRHLRRETAGIRALQRAGVPTPGILFAGKAKNSACGVLVTEYLERTKSLTDLWAGEIDPDHRFRLLKVLAGLIAQMHRHGLFQRDLHPGNFLVSGDRIYSVDGSAIRVGSSPRPLNTRASLSNLASLFSLSKFQDPLLIRDLYAAYCKERGWERSEKQFLSLENTARAYRRRGMRRYFRKILRNSTEIVCRRSFRRLMLCRRTRFTPQMEAFLESPDAVLGRPETKRVKTGNTSTVSLVRIDDRVLAVKRYNIKGISHGMKRCLRRTRAARSWRNAHRLKKMGIETPEPVAMVEKRLGPLRFEAFYIGEYVGGPLAETYFADGAGHTKVEDARRIADILGTLESDRISHGDLKASNIIVREEGPVLLDLDAMREHRIRKRFEAARRKDLSRFFLNWKHYPRVEALFRGLILDREIGLHAGVEKLSKHAQN